MALIDGEESVAISNRPNSFFMVHLLKSWHEERRPHSANVMHRISFPRYLFYGMAKFRARRTAFRLVRCLIPLFL